MKLGDCCAVWAACVGWAMWAAACGAQAPAGAAAGSVAAVGEATEAQVLAGKFPAVANDDDPPPVHGMNLAVSYLSQHSSVTGWSTEMTPELSYRINPHFLLDASVPWYWKLRNYVPVTVKSVTTYPLLVAESVIGDTNLAGQMHFDFGDFSYNLTATGGLPTGETSFGLSANVPTYNVTNHLEYNIGPLTLDAEAGQGDSSDLANNTLIKESYIAVGPVANFQAGGSIELPLKWNLDLEAFEEMPIGNQNVYGTVTKKVKGKNVTTQVLEGTGVAEDNGFQSELDLPVAEHLVLSANYERSLRQGTDTVGIGFTWTLRVPKKH